jgi:amino-acid N-acetyltransferase
VTVTPVREGLAYGPAHSTDEPAIKALLAESSLPTSDLAPGGLAHFLVCREAGRVVGVVGLEAAGDAALLRSLVVAPERRGSGIGRGLVRRAEAHARGLGVHALYLLTTTAERFFGARGYRPADRDSVPDAVRATAEFSTLCPSTAACMIKRLPA